MNNPQLLIDAIVQQTMVFIAHLATAGGIRAPLAGLANQIFADLTDELQKQGVKQRVIADMFGMALRTYHRKSQELRQSHSDEGQTLWEAVYDYVRQKNRVSTTDILVRFKRDDLDVVTGILNDLVSTGLVYRTGRGNLATYKLADQEDFDSLDRSRTEANCYLVWLGVYRHGPLDLAQITALSRIKVDACTVALAELVKEGKVSAIQKGELTLYQSDCLDVPLGSTQGWEAAVLDHYQAMIGAISHKLTIGPSPVGTPDLIGGSTWSLDVWAGHPFEQEAKGTLARIRSEVESLRQRIDDHNRSHPRKANPARVLIYAGQNLRTDDQ